MTMKTRTAISAIAALAMAGLPLAAQADSVTAAENEIVVTLLGTGTPAPLMDRFGYATLISAGEHLLLFDVGRGAVQRLWQVGIKPGDVDEVFLTHYHSDHLTSLPDMWLTSWLVPYGAKAKPFRITGPTGLAALTKGLTAAFAADIKIRIEDQNLPAEGVAWDVTEFSEDGVVYDQDGMTVTAFTVNHGEKIKPAVGYKIEYGGHTVVLSGDTKKNENVVAQATGANLLVHQVAMAADAIKNNPPIVAIMGHHTSPVEAGEVFAASAPGLAVYSHIVRLGPPNAPEISLEALVEQTRQTYDGPLEVGADLMTITIGDDVTVGTADTR